jgi:hypothetical protein
MHFDLGTTWRSVVSFTPRQFYTQGNSSYYSLGRKLGGPQSRSGRGGEENNSQPLLGLEPPRNHATILFQREFTMQYTPIEIQYLMNFVFVVDTEVS